MPDYTILQFWFMSSQTVVLRNFLLVCAALLFVSVCQAQVPYNKEDYAPISFLSYVNGEYVDILAVTVERSANSYEISLPYYEFPTSKIDVGEACMFAVTKDLSREWEEKAIATPKGDCDIKDDYLPSFYVTCEAARLITKDTTALLNKFDLYSFLIKKSDLAGPFNSP